MLRCRFSELPARPSPTVVSCRGMSASALTADGRSGEDLSARDALRAVLTRERPRVRPLPAALAAVRSSCPDTTCDERRSRCEIQCRRGVDQEGERALHRSLTCGTEAAKKARSTFREQDRTRTRTNSLELKFQPLKRLCARACDTTVPVHAVRAFSARSDSWIATAGSSESPAAGPACRGVACDELRSSRAAAPPPLHVCKAFSLCRADKSQIVSLRHATYSGHQFKSFSMTAGRASRTGPTLILVNRFEL